MSYCIITYDVGEERVNRVRKILKRYLNWVQNSVFEGEISVAHLEKLKIELNRIINDEEDSVIIYQFRTTRYSSVEIMGIKKGGEENFL